MKKDCAERRDSLPDCAVFLFAPCFMRQGARFLFRDKRVPPVLCRRHAGPLAELPHEMKLAVIAAEGGDMVHGHVTLPQVHLRQLDPGKNDVAAAGNIKILFIQVLKMRKADI